MAEGVDQQTQFTEFYPPEYKPEGNLIDFLAKVGLDGTVWPLEDNPPMHVLVFDMKVFAALRVATGHTSDLWDAAVLFAYTYDSDLFRRANRAMRLNNTTQIEYWRPFIYWVDKALNAVPSALQPIQVYRGISTRVADILNIYQPGLTVHWAAFSSTSLSWKVARQFLSSGEGVVFIVHGKSCRPIQQFSSYPYEKELLFPPNTKFRVRQIFKVDVRAFLTQDRQPLPVDLAAGVKVLGVELVETSLDDIWAADQTSGRGGVQTTSEVDDRVVGVNPIDAGSPTHSSPRQDGIWP
eukprot:TRINITY_DN46903_c0_g1_i1.p1 TRINITY_DN46903_c0_g1~~TRINITY_DN46903_c0_g1_i1.p1  ORF type:complete len:315 (+),score=32.63 TRINITY_DN46903_c0_g1_i1:62-946(+)